MSHGWLDDYFNPHFRKGSDEEMHWWKFMILLISIHTSAREVTDSWCPQSVPCGISIHTSAREVTDPCSNLCSGCIWFQSTLPQGKWLQYFTKTSVYFYEISINIFEFTFVYYWNTLSIQKAHSNLFIFTGASLPVILCMLDTRTCKL